MNALDLLIQSGKLTPAQAGALGLGVQVLMALGLILLALWGWNYNEQINLHHCAAVCHVLDTTNGVRYYPQCEATGENVTALQLPTQVLNPRLDPSGRVAPMPVVG